VMAKVKERRHRWEVAHCAHSSHDGSSHAATHHHCHTPHSFGGTAAWHLDTQRKYERTMQTGLAEGHASVAVLGQSMHRCPPPPPLYCRSHAMRMTGHGRSQVEVQESHDAHMKRVQTTDAPIDHDHADDVDRNEVALDVLSWGSALNVAVVHGLAAAVDHMDDDCHSQLLCRLGQVSMLVVYQLPVEH